MKTYLALTILFLSSVLIVVGLTPWAAEGGQATFQDGSYVGYPMPMIKVTPWQR